MPSTRSIEVLAPAADLFHAAAEEFVGVARAAIGAQGRFTVALSGGSTPKALYSLLATNYADFVWNRIFLFFGDERHVPPTDPESNYRMVNESLLTKIAIPAENVFSVPAENPDASTALAKGAAIRRKTVVDARRIRRRQTNSVKSGSFSVLSCQFSVNNCVPSGQSRFLRTLGWET